MLGTTAHAQLPRLSVSPGGRVLLKGDKPFFWMGDTNWYLHKLSLEEVDQYLNDRRDKGFNVIQGPSMQNDVPNVHGELNIAGESINEAWFAYLDQIIDRCAAHQMYIAPVLTWGTKASLFTPETAFAYGRFFGARYRDRTNIAAIFIAGEFNHPSSNVALWTAMANGVIDGLDGAPVIITALPRWYNGQSSSYDLHNQPWLTMNTHQSSVYGDCTNDPSHSYYMGTHNWLIAEHDWALEPRKPFIDAEATYEQQSPVNGWCPMNPNRWPAFGVRRRAYWSVFAGAAGHTYGANGVWQWYRPGETNPAWNPNAFWFDAMNFPGAFNMTHLHALMRSRPMLDRVPAQEMLIEGSTELVPFHVHATRAADGSFAMIYVPETGKTITIDMNALAGDSHRVWWFDPMTGGASMFGEFKRRSYGENGEFTITTPAIGEDWVLVVDDLTANFPEPGDADLRVRGDVNGDELVNVSDLLSVISMWGPCNTPPTAPCMSDIAPWTEGDGTVDVSDLLLVIANWGS